MLKAEAVLETEGAAEAVPRAMAQQEAAVVLAETTGVARAAVTEVAMAVVREAAAMATAIAVETVGLVAAGQEAQEAQHS